MYNATSLWQTISKNVSYVCKQNIQANTDKCTHVSK